MQIGRHLQSEHGEGLGERDRETARRAACGVLPDSLQQNMASDRLIEFLAGAYLQGSIVRVEVDAIDVGAQSIGERRPLKVVDDPCPKTSVGVEVVAEATEGVTQSSAFVLPGVGRQRRLEHPGCSEEIDDLPSALEAGSSVVVGCVDQNLADAFRLAHGAVRTSSGGRRVAGLKSGSCDCSVEFVMAGASATLEEVTQHRPQFDQVHASYRRSRARAREAVRRLSSKHRAAPGRMVGCVGCPPPAGHTPVSLSWHDERAHDASGDLTGRETVRTIS